MAIVSSFGLTIAESDEDMAEMLGTLASRMKSKAKAPSSLVRNLAIAWVAMIRPGRVVSGRSLLVIEGTQQWVRRRDLAPENKLARPTICAPSGAPLERCLPNATRNASASNCGKAAMVSIIDRQSW